MNFKIIYLLFLGTLLSNCSSFIHAAQFDPKDDLNTSLLITGLDKYESSYPETGLTPRETLLVSSIHNPQLSSMITALLYFGHYRRIRICALHSAVQNLLLYGTNLKHHEQSSILRTLLTAVERNRPDIPVTSLINVPLSSGTTFLHLCVNTANPVATKIVLEAGAMVDAREIKYGLTPSGLALAQMAACSTQDPIRNSNLASIIIMLRATGANSYEAVSNHNENNLFEQAETYGKLTGNDECKKVGLFLKENDFSEADQILRIKEGTRDVSTIQSLHNKQNDLLRKYYDHYDRFDIRGPLKRLEDGISSIFKS